MAGAEAIFDLVVVARARIGVFDEQPDRGARGAALEDTRQNADLVAFAALADEVGRPRAAPVDVPLDLLFGNLQSRRAAVHDAAHGGPVALAKCGDRKKNACRVTGHYRGRGSIVPPSAGRLRRPRARIQAT